jgi:glycosyltransferase involved in cell wall biosynthesis
MCRARKPRLLFVGAFTPASDGLTGGTYAACKQLLDGDLGELFEIISMDVSQVTPHSRALWHRAFAGGGRLLRTMALVLTGRVEKALIFATLGPSWFERGLIAMVCRLGAVHTLVFARSGEINRMIEENSLVRNFTRMMLWSGVHFVFQGEALRRRFLNVLPSASKHVHAVMNWIDLRWRAGVGPMIAREPVTVLYMGWLHPWKGVDILIEGLARNTALFRGCRFVLCGDGQSRAVLEDAAGRTGLDIEFRGWTHGAAKKAAFTDAQIVVLPSRVEGMPNILLEAMSVGRPVIATRVGSVADLVQDGVEGILVPPQQPDALAEALLILARNPALRARMGAAGKLRIEQNHDLEKAGKKVVDLLTSL